MKGLLIKDILNMKNYMKQLVLVLIFFIAYGIFLKNGTFVGTMITLMLSMQVITTMSYDEYAKWDKYALTMNINRKDIIISKYIFFTISIIILFVLLTHLKSDLWNFPRATLKCEISIVLITTCLPCCLN